MKSGKVQIIEIYTLKFHQCSTHGLLWPHFGGHRGEAVDSIFEDKLITLIRVSAGCVLRSSIPSWSARRRLMQSDISLNRHVNIEAD